MAFRNDLSIDWSVSPRIITVDSPSTSLDVKDLYDTLRTAEAQASNMDEPFITDAGGYEPLGGGVKVGITVTLRDALVAFEARPGPTYEQMRITGGNMVTYDPNLDQYLDSSVSPTAFTQVVQANSSSATLQELGAIQYGSYAGGVTIDIVNGTPGTGYPIGTPQSPSNNLADTATILTNVGLGTIYVKGDLTLDNTASWQGISFIGASATKTTITIQPAANVLDCEFSYATITGTLDGASDIRECIVTNLLFADGFIGDSGLGDITLGTTVQADIFQSYSTVAGITTPEIDMNGTGILALRDYNGGALLKNYTGAGSHSIDLSSGQIKLDTTTITSGTFVVRGVGKLVDELGNPILTGTWNGGVTIVNELITAGSIGANVDAGEIADAVWDELVVDHTTAGTMGEKQGTAAAGSDVDAIWNEPTINHTTPGSTGKALIDAGAGGNPWDTPTSSSNTPGTFGYLLGTTFLGYLTTIYNTVISISNSLAQASVAGIRVITGQQPNQK